MKRAHTQSAEARPDQRPGARAERQAQAGPVASFAWSTGLADAPRARILPEGSGGPMSSTLRQRLVGRFGTDLGAVRLHDDAIGAEVAEDRGAHALAEGRHIYFGRGAFAPHTVQGLARIEHELTHVAQQERAGGTGASLADEQSAGGGYGATAPRMTYEVAEGRAEEGAHVLFDHDDIHVDEETLADAIALVQGRREAVIIEIHGYASSEGREEYNMNLSAHRAARVKRELRPYLPEGSEVLLFAHGETSAFGRRYAPNRRVGLSLRPKPQPAEAESSAAVPLISRASRTTDPQPAAEEGDELPRVPEQIEVPPAWVRPPLYWPHLDLGRPDPLRVDLPVLRPGCPFAPGLDQMDWFEIMRPLRGRGGQLSDEQTLSLVESWSAAACTYSRILTPILGPDLAGDAAAAGVNIGLSSAMESSAYWENPTHLDRYDQLLRQQGVETTIIPVSDIIIGFYRFITH